ncbi:MAG TPA: four helix bundle protein, partial [Bacteroidales bacterium]|nr:four helix bundle protein [Bacteroidales bacterium]
MGDFTKIEVWKKSKNIAVKIYSITTSQMFVKDFDLINQRRRAAVSIPSNIAEGEESGSNPQSTRFFNIAKGSAAELKTQIIISYEIGYLQESLYKEIYGEVCQISIMLHKIIKHRKNHN